MPRTLVMNPTVEDSPPQSPALVRRSDPTQPAAQQRLHMQFGGEARLLSRLSRLREHQSFRPIFTYVAKDIAHKKLNGIEIASSFQRGCHLIANAEPPAFKVIVGQIHEKVIPGLARNRHDALLVAQTQFALLSCSEDRFGDQEKLLKQMGDIRLPHKPAALLELIAQKLARRQCMKPIDVAVACAAALREYCLTKQMPKEQLPAYLREVFHATKQLMRACCSNGYVSAEAITLFEIRNRKKYGVAA